MTFAEGKALSQIPAEAEEHDDGLGRAIRQQDPGALSLIELAAVLVRCTVSCCRFFCFCLSWSMPRWRSHSASIEARRRPRLAALPAGFLQSRPNFIGCCRAHPRRQGGRQCRLHPARHLFSLWRVPCRGTGPRQGGHLVLSGGQQRDLAARHCALVCIRHSAGVERNRHRWRCAALLGATAKAMGNTVRVIEIVSYALILLIGLRLLWVKGSAFLRALRLTRSACP